MTTQPTVRSSSSAGGDNATTATPAKPSGLAVGDLMLAFQESDADGVLASMTAPSGFTAIASQAPTAGTNIPAVKVWRKVADSSDVAASTFAFPDDAGSNCSVDLIAITAGTYDSTNLTSTPSFTTQGNASGASINAPSVTGVVDALLLCGFAPDTGGTLRSFTTPIPTGMSLVVESAAGSSTYTRLAVYSQTLSTTDATGTKTATLTASPNGYVGVTVMVLPANGGGGTASFGKSTDGGSVTSSSATKISIATATPSSSGTLTAGHARVWLDAAGTTNTKIVVYSDSAGAPSTLLATSDEVAVTATSEGQRDYTFSGANQIAITSGTPYWLGIMWSDPGTPNVQISRDNTASARYERSASASPTWTYPNAPSSFGTLEGPFSGPSDVWVDYQLPGSVEGGRAMFLGA